MKQTCTHLRNIAKEFNEKVGIVNQAVTDAFNHHKTRAAEMLSYVKEYLVARATNFKCESVISAEVGILVNSGVIYRNPLNI